MKTIGKCLMSFAISISLISSAMAQIKSNEKAPDFTLQDHKGNTHILSNYQGQTVVLEWVNYDCPFVKKHYNAGNMQNLQKKYTEEGVIWLSINSSAKGKQGNFAADEITKRILDQQAEPTAYLIDEDGTVGKLYNAKTTPHMFIIDTKGTLIYQGAIDDDPSVWGSDPHQAHNYVRTVLEKHLAGLKSPIDETKAYGCSVKY